MLDEIVLSAIMTGLIVLIGSYASFRLIKKNMVEEIFDVINTEQGQKFIYSVGVLIGNGAKQGLGITKGSGKLSLNNIILGAASTWIEQAFGKKPEEQNA